MDEDRDRDLLFEYNCLTDKHLQGYFSSASVQRHLHDMGLITRNGRMVPEREYQRQWVKKQQQLIARRMLVRSLANQTREYEINRQLELQRQLDAVRKVETYRKIRGSAAYENQPPLMHVPPIALERSLTRSHSSPGFRHLRRSAKLPETLGNVEGNNDGGQTDQHNLEPIGQRRNSAPLDEDEKPPQTADTREADVLRGCFSELHIHHYQQLISSLNRTDKKNVDAIGDFNRIERRSKNRLPWQNLTNQQADQNSEQTALDLVISRSDLMCRSLKLRAKALQPLSPCKQLKDRQLKRYLEDVYKYSYLHKLDAVSLRMYRNHLIREIQRIRGIRQSFDVDDSEEIFSPSSTQSGLTPLPPVHPRMVGIDGRKSFSPTRLPSRGKTLWTHENLKSAASRPSAKERKLSPVGKKLSDNRAQRSRIFMTSAAARKKPNQSCQCFIQYLGSNSKLSQEGVESEQITSKVAVIQQHCGGGQISLFHGELKKGDKFKFFSQRHVGYPFSLLMYENDIVVTKVNTCCESRYKPKTRLGGKQGLFRWLGVKKAYPCHKCQIERNFQPPFSNCQTNSDESSTSAAASLHRRLEKPHRFTGNERAANIGKPKAKETGVTVVKEPNAMPPAETVVLANPDILCIGGSQMLIEKPSSAGTSNKPDVVNHQPTATYMEEPKEEVVEVKATVNYSDKNSLDSDEDSSSSSYSDEDDSETDYGEPPKAEPPAQKSSDDTHDFFDDTEPQKEEVVEAPVKQEEENNEVEVHDNSDNESKPDTHKTEDSDMKVEAASISSHHSQARSITPVLAEVAKAPGDGSSEESGSEESSEDELEVTDEKQQEIAEKLRIASAILLGGGTGGDQTPSQPQTAESSNEDLQKPNEQSEQVEVQPVIVEDQLEQTQPEEVVRADQPDQEESESASNTGSEEGSSEEAESEGEEQSLAVSVNEKSSSERKESGESQVNEEAIEDLNEIQKDEEDNPDQTVAVIEEEPTQVEPEENIKAKEEKSSSEVSPSPTASTVRNASVNESVKSSARQSSAASTMSRKSSGQSQASRPPTSQSQKSSRPQSAAISHRSGRSASAASIKSGRPQSTGSQQPKVQISPASVSSEPPGIERDEETLENDRDTLSVSRTSQSRTKSSVESSQQSLQSVSTESSESSAATGSTVRKISEESEGAEDSEESKSPADRHSSAQQSVRSESATTSRKASEQTATDAESNEYESESSRKSSSNQAESVEQSQSDLNEKAADTEEIVPSTTQMETIQPSGSHIEIVVKAPTPLLQMISGGTTPSVSPRISEDHRWFSLDESAKVPISHGEIEGDTMEEKSLQNHPIATQAGENELKEEVANELDEGKFTSHLSEGLEEGLKEEEKAEEQHESVHHVHFEGETTGAVQIDNDKQAKLDRLSPDLAALCEKSDVTITNRNLSLAEIESVGAALSMHNDIRSINFRSVGLDDDGLRILANFLSDNTSPTKVLTLNSNQVTDEGVPDLIKIMQKRPIEILQVSENCLADDGIVALLNNLKEMEVANGQVLTRIDLGENGVGDEGATAVGAYLSGNNHLQKLSLSGSTEVTQLGWNAIAEGVGNNQKLQVLSFDYCKMGDSACSALCKALKGNPTLKSLDLEGNDLTEVCVPDIIEMIRSCDNVNNICLTAGNNISTDSLNRIRQIITGKQPGAADNKDLLSVSSAMTR